MQLPDSIANAVQPLFDLLPPDQAMAKLVVSPTTGSATPEQAACVEGIVAQPAIAAKPELASALWLYVDELDKSHTISQGIEDPTGSYWHGIMHRREGDFSNSHYWFRKVGDHPAMPEIGGEYDGHAFVDEVEAAVESGEGAGPLVAKQRLEWQTLFEWCANQ